MYVFVICVYVISNVLSHNVDSVKEMCLYLFVSFARF